MTDYELSLLPEWRYTNVSNGDKKPYPNNWQNTPLQLSQVVSNNIGLQLGQHSNGTCAIDFDGPEAIDFWTTTFPQHSIDSLNTIMWSSGKEYRCQAAFSIPSEYWDVLKRKVTHNLEFRWGGQSVMPPSKLNDGRQYFWINSPCTTKLRQIPDDILTYWLTLLLNDIPIQNYEPIERPKLNDDAIVQLAEELKRHYPQLDYDTWIRVTWAFCNELGTSDGVSIMKYHYPESKQGEYRKFYHNSNVGKKISIGTVIKMIKDKGGMIKVPKQTYLESRLAEIQNKLRKMK
jgi:hypothetical protein